MARKLKVYQTSLGFFDLAVAAPSMKAALEAWGSDSNLFHQGAAGEVDDPAVVAATMARPGVVMKRPVGSSGLFKEHAELPKNLPAGKVETPRAKPKTRSGAKAKKKEKEPPHRKSDDKASREAVLNFEKERKRREAEHRKEDAAREKQRNRREQAIAKAQAALDEARRKHDRAIEEIESERAVLDGRAQAEDARWSKQKKVLEEDLRRARN